MSSAAPEYAFATPFLNPPASPIRSLMPYAMRPGTISLAGGYPAQELFDVDGLTIASTQVLARLGACLQYSNIDGQASLRNELARLSAARGLHCNADTELAVTGGSQQAMALLTRVMLQPGDHAVIESPAFPNSVQALRYTGATVHTVPSGPDGVDIDALDELAARVKPKVVCVVASFSNPCGATISRQRRLRLLELAVKHRFLIVEDDPYSELRFAGEAVPPIMALAEGEARNWAVYLASMSKTMAPALRIGWLVAPAEIRRRCVGAKAADDMASSTWIQEVVAQYLANGRYEEHVPRIRAAYGVGDDIDIVFAPSGTDLEYVALALALGRSDQGIHNVLLGADETGSGCIHSAHGRFFANETALVGGVAPGEDIAGMGEITLVDVPVRCSDGEARTSAEIGSSAARRRSCRAGWRPLSSCGRVTGWRRPVIATPRRWGGATAAWRCAIPGRAGGLARPPAR